MFASIARRFITLVIGISVTACGTAGEAALALEQESVNLGSIDVGDDLTATLVVRNVGAGSAQILLVAVTGAGAVTSQPPGISCAVDHAGTIVVVGSATDDIAILRYFQ